MTGVKLRGFPKQIPSLKLTAKAPENWPSQKETNIPTIHFQMGTVSFREGTHANLNRASVQVVI